MKNAIYMLNGGSGDYAQDLLNSFIITSENGTVIVIDGGHDRSVKHFLEKLREITGQAVPRVNAWFLTHTHEDHIQCFTDIMTNQPESVIVEKLYYNFSFTGEELIAESGKNSKVLFNMLRDFYVFLPNYGGEVVIPELGDEITVNEFKFEVLHTAKVQTGARDCNDKSLVLKMHFNGKTVMFLADIGVPAAKKILLSFPAEKLKADICQMAHHGQCGAHKEFYEAVRPEICLWPTPDYLWNNDLGKGYNTAFFKTVEVRGWMDELGVKENYTIKDGDQVVYL